MRGTRNTIRLHRAVQPSSVWQGVKGWARRNVANEKIARNALAFAGAVSICYVVVRLVHGLQSYVAYAY
jgi:hypothetical protein